MLLFNAVAVAMRQFWSDAAAFFFAAAAAAAAVAVAVAATDGDKDEDDEDDEDEEDEEDDDDADNGTLEPPEDTGPVDVPVEIASCVFATADALADPSGFIAVTAVY